MRKQWFLTSFIALTLVAALMVPATALAQPPMVRVLIGFDRQPGPAEQAIVHGVGGRVIFNYRGK